MIDLSCKKEKEEETLVQDTYVETVALHGCLYYYCYYIVSEV